MYYPVLDMKATGEKIKELRTKKQISVETISSYMGFGSAQAVYKWQAGKSLPTVDNLYALSRLLEVEIEDILVEVEHEEEPCYEPAM